jgi:hypothetical protein
MEEQETEKSRVVKCIVSMLVASVIGMIYIIL